MKRLCVLAVFFLSSSFAQANSNGNHLPTSSKVDGLLRDLDETVSQISNNWTALRSQFLNSSGEEFEKMKQLYEAKHYDNQEVTMKVFESHKRKLHECFTDPLEAMNFEIADSQRTGKWILDMLTSITNNCESNMRKSFESTKECIDYEVAIVRVYLMSFRTTVFKSQSRKWTSSMQEAMECSRRLKSKFD